MSKSDALPKVVQDCHNCLLWMIPKLDQFPRQRRYTLGERIESHLLEVLELLTAAAYQRNKRATLALANQKLAVLRHLWRLSMELNALPHRAWQYGSGLLEEIGRQIGGWAKSGH